MALETAELIAATKEESDPLMDDALLGNPAKVDTTESRWPDASLALLGALDRASAIEVTEVEIALVFPLRSGTAGAAAAGGCFHHAASS